jgi:hypothetical protein
MTTYTHVYLSQNLFKVNIMLAGAVISFFFINVQLLSMKHIVGFFFLFLLFFYFLVLSHVTLPMTFASYFFIPCCRTSILFFIFTFNYSVVMFSDDRHACRENKYKHVNLECTSLDFFHSTFFNEPL